MGPLAVTAIADQVHAAGAKIDVHLMIERPERQVEAFAAGRRGLDHDPRRGHAAPALHVAGDQGRGLPDSGLALNPGTPAEAVGELEPDMVLCMTVNPGWGGQRFLEHSLGKLERLRALIGPDSGARGRRRDRRRNRRESALRRAPRCSSPGPRCSAPTIPPKPSRPSRSAVAGRPVESARSCCTASRM